MQLMSEKYDKKLSKRLSSEYQIFFNFKSYRNSFFVFICLCFSALWGNACSYQYVMDWDTYLYLALLVTKHWGFLKVHTLCETKNSRMPGKRIYQVGLCCDNRYIDEVYPYALNAIFIAVKYEPINRFYVTLLIFSQNSKPTVSCILKN